MKKQAITVDPSVAIETFVKLPKWLLDTDISSRALHVYAIIGSYADQKGFCWPSIDTVAQRSHMSRATVIRAISELTKLGALSVETRRNDKGAQTSNGYHLACRDPHVIHDPHVMGDMPPIAPMTCPPCHPRHSPHVMGDTQSRIIDRDPEIEIHLSSIDDDEAVQGLDNDTTTATDASPAATSVDEAPVVDEPAKLTQEEIYEIALTYSGHADVADRWLVEIEKGKWPSTKAVRTLMDNFSIPVPWTEARSARSSRISASYEPIPPAKPVVYTEEENLRIAAMRERMRDLDDMTPAHAAPVQQDDVASPAYLAEVSETLNALRLSRAV